MGKAFLHRGYKEGKRGQKWSIEGVGSRYRGGSRVVAKRGWYLLLPSFDYYMFRFFVLLELRDYFHTYFGPISMCRYLESALLVLFGAF